MIIEQHSTAECSADLHQRRLEGMLRIASGLGRYRDPEQAMRAIVQEVSALLDATRTTVYELRPEAQNLRGLAVEGEDAVTVMVPLGHGVAGQVAQRGRAINLKDAYRHPNFDPSFDRRTGFVTRSMLAVPMRDSTQRILGVVQVLNKRTGYFTVEDQQVLQALANQAAVTLEALYLRLENELSNTELLGLNRELKRRTEELAFLFENEQRMGAIHDPLALAEAVLSATAQVARCERVALFVLEDEQTGPVYVQDTPDAPVRIVGRETLGVGPLGRTAAIGTGLVLLGDSFEAHGVAPHLGGDCRLKVTDIVTAPLMDHDVVIGALALVNRAAGNRREDTEDLRLAVLIAAPIARALVRIQTQKSALQNDRLQTIGQMLSGVLHDLKGPMTIISGYAQLLATAERAEDRKEMSATIRRQVSLFNDMTLEVMSFARGERSVFARRTHVRQLVAAVREHMEGEFKVAGLTLEINNLTRGTGYYDDSKMLRLVTNIARNARQAMPAGGTFRWTLEDTDAGGLRFIFDDDGPGIPDAIRTTLFDAFITEGKATGTGLGLAIVHQIVDDHEGQICVESEAGHGTRFTVTLPPAPSTETEG